MILILIAEIFDWDLYVAVGLVMGLGGQSVLVSDILNGNKIKTRKIAKADFLKYFLEQ